MQPPIDVLIVGAGPVGLALAIGLTRASLRVRIVDKAPETKREQRAAVVWPRAAEVLADLGIARAFEDAANPLHSADVYAAGRRLGRLDVGHVHSAHPHPLIIEQHETERLFADHLQSLGVRVEWRTEAVDVRLFEDRAEVLVRRPDGARETLTSAWVVGCEGTRSLVREKVGIPFTGVRRENLQVVQVNAVPTWRFPPSRVHGYFFLDPRVSVGVYPIPSGGYRFFCFLTDPDPRRKDPPTLAEMRDLIAAAARAPELDLAPTAPLWLNRARFQDRVATTLRRGRALLAGDAAHAWAPVGGHGMNAGIRGAHNLAWKLAAVVCGESHPRLLDTYSDEQRATARAIMSEMRFNLLELPLPPLALHAVRAALPLALRSRAVRRRIEFVLSDLGMHYRASALSRQRVPGRHLHAGDRAPDVPVVADGARAMLHRLLSPRHWTLVLPAAPEHGAAVRRAREVAAAFHAPIRVAPVAPAGATAARALGGDRLMILVRPDAHIGLLARCDDTRALAEYLDLFLVRA